MSSKLMVWLMANYLVILVASVLEGNFARATYWLGALIISAGVLWMGR